MSLSRSISAYTDILNILERAILSNGMTLTFESPALAKRWRARAYMARKLLRDHTPGGTPYDNLTIILEDAVKLRLVFAASAGAGIIQAESPGGWTIPINDLIPPALPIEEILK